MDKLNPPEERQCQECGQWSGPHAPGCSFGEDRPVETQWVLDLVEPCGFDQIIVRGEKLGIYQGEVVLRFTRKQWTEFCSTIDVLWREAERGR